MKSRKRDEKTARVHMKLSPRSKRELAALAARHNRSMTGEVEDMIAERARRELQR